MYTKIFSHWRNYQMSSQMFDKYYNFSTHWKVLYILIIWCWLLILCIHLHIRPTGSSIRTVVIHPSIHLSLYPSLQPSEAWSWFLLRSWLRFLGFTLRIKQELCKDHGRIHRSGHGGGIAKEGYGTSNCQVSQTSSCSWASEIGVRGRRGWNRGRGLQTS